MNKDTILNQPSTIGQAVASRDENPDFWELDTQPFVERIYHELLGEIPNENGEWEKDQKRIKVMNELGASEFIQEISIRVNPHQQLSELEDNEILEIASRGAEIYADKIEDNWAEWEITPSSSNFESISQRLFDVLFIALRSARRGAMKTYRERRKAHYLINNQQGQDEGVL